MQSVLSEKASAQNETEKRPASVPKHGRSSAPYRSAVCFTSSNTGTGRNIRARDAAPAVVHAKRSHYPQRLPGKVKSNATGAAESDVQGLPCNA